MFNRYEGFTSFGEIRAIFCAECVVQRGKKMYSQLATMTDD